MKNEKTIKTIIVLILAMVILWFGIKPLLLGTSFKEYTRIRSEALNFADNEYGTIVIGSEPEGIASAIACARTGLKTLIITEDSDLGSYIKNCMISKMDPQMGIIDKEKALLNRGIYKEIFGKFTIGFSSEEYEQTVKKLVSKEKNLEIILDSYILEVDLEGDYIKGVLIQQPDGKHYYRAKTYIDATTDGDLLTLCEIPYTKGSEDLGFENYYSPLEFNFLVSGVDIEALKKSRKISDFEFEFKTALLAYEKVNPRTKLVSPSFISQNEDELVITGLTVFGVNIEDKEDMEAAFKEAEEEARMLTAYLKTSLVAFKDCTYRSGPKEFFIPEYRHFEGRYKLTVADILEMRNFSSKIALASGDVDAGKFVNTNINLTVVSPNVYSIPVGCIIPSKVQNVLMIGAKASFTSLAATSAGSLPTRITVGEAAGLLSAYCFINEMDVAQLAALSGKDLITMTNYLKRGDIYLSDFSESIMLPNTDTKLSDHWAYPYVKTLVEYGLITGGENNDYRLDYKASNELLTVLLKNAMIKMAPDMYSIDIDQRLKPYEKQEQLTGEIASAMVLEVLDISYTKGGAFDILKSKNLISAEITDRLKKDEPVTLDVVYGLAVETINSME